MLKRLGLRELGSSDAAMLFVYFAAPLLTLVAVVAVAAALRRYLPTPYAWLTGGRGGQSARRSHGRRPAEDPAAATDIEGEPALAEAGGAPEPVRRGS